MFDMQKIKKGLECCSDPSVAGCRDCPYDDSAICSSMLAKDALKLLKELGLKEQISDAIHETAKLFRRGKEERK